MTELNSLKEAINKRFNDLSSNVFPCFDSHYSNQAHDTLSGFDLCMKTLGYSVEQRIEVIEASLQDDDDLNKVILDFIDCLKSE